MEAMRQSWTDDRLDDRFDHLEAEMAERFKRVDESFDHVEAEMNQRFERVEGEMKALRAEMKIDNRELRAEMSREIKGESRQLRADFGEDVAELRKDNRELLASIVALQRTMVQVCGAVIAVLIGYVITQALG